jgi:excisionase family DNA binding protein
VSSQRINAPDLLKPAEVAARLGVSRTWLYEAARTGRIPSIRIGGRDGPLRFIPEDLQRWIDEARAGMAARWPSPSDALSRCASF